MASFYKNGKTFTVAYDGSLDGKPKGHRSYIYGIKSRKLAEQAKSRKDNEEQLLHARLLHVDPHAGKLRQAEQAPIAELVDTFYRSIVSRGKVAKHARTQAQHVRRLVKMAGVTAVPQLEAEPIQAAAARLMEDGLGPRTANAALKAMRQFSRWLARTHRTRYDVLHDKLELYNEEVDRRRQRRAMTEEEVQWLLATTETATDFISRRCGIKPADRAMLYAVGIGTGLRQAALLTLTKSSFYIAETNLRPFVRLAAASNKKRKDRDQPIRRDLAARLREWLKDKPDTGRVWKAAPHADLSLRFRRDMEHARAAWLAASPTPAERKLREGKSTLQYEYHDGVRKVYADFHGLRHTGITLVVRHAGLKVGQIWADHSTPVLTAKYAHMDLTDEDKALDALPETAAKGDLAPWLARRPESTGKVRKDSERRKIG